MSTLRIVLDFKNGPAVPDLKAKEYIYERLNEFNGMRDVELVLGTDVMLSEVRLALITDKADIYPMVELYSHDLLLSLDKYGRIDDWCNIDDRGMELASLIVGVEIELWNQKKAQLLLDHPEMRERYLEQNSTFRYWWDAHPEFHEDTTH